MGRRIFLYGRPLKLRVDNAPVSTSSTSLAIGSNAARKCCMDLTTMVDLRVGSTPNDVNCARSVACPLCVITMISTPPTRSRALKP